MTAGIAIDDRKLPIFERRLSEAGYTYTTSAGLTKNTLLLKVETSDIKALEVIVRAANDEARKMRNK